jgi:DNA-binding MarR family transcriptional regulator
MVQEPDATDAPLTEQDYATLADFRYALRQFLAFSEERASAHGLTPQQHQALLAIRGAGERPATIGYVAERLFLKPHSATGLIDRLVALGLVERRPSPEDRRVALLNLTPRSRDLLAQLSTTHRQEILRLRPLLTSLLGQLAQS